MKRFAPFKRLKGNALRLHTLAGLVAALALSSLFAGCETLKGFLARDLEDEDFIIGQLYADELVNEVPVIAQPVRVTPRTDECRNALGLTCGDGENKSLYETVNSWLGVPYKYGGTDRNGIDCSAFVGAVYRKVYGVSLRRTCNDILNDVSLVSRPHLREGDLLFFTNSKGKVSHVGIYLKDGLFAHASTSNGVSVSSVDSGYWQKHFYKGGRVKQ